MGSSASKGKLAQTPPVRSPSPPNFCPSPATPKDTDYRSAGGDAGDPLPTQQADIIGTVSMSSSGGVQVDVPVTVDDISMRGCAEVLQAPMFLDWVKTCEADPKLFIRSLSGTNASSSTRGPASAAIFEPAVLEILSAAIASASFQDTGEREPSAERMRGMSSLCRLRPSTA